MLVKIKGAAVYGIDALAITIEVNIERGINYFLVGLPDNAVKESQKRIEAALANNQYSLPGKGIIINMAPADIRKEGASYDLPIAIGILAASEQIHSSHLDDMLIMGELALDGTLRTVRGALPMAILAKELGLKYMVVPGVNAKEAAVVEGIKVLGATNIVEAIEAIQNPDLAQETRIDPSELFNIHHQFPYDFADVKGHESIKRALEIAAAGGHNILLIGPPGSGKTMLAQRVVTILPPFSLEEAIETTQIHSVAGNLGENESLLKNRPFRHPHHTISDVALVGGGSNPKPGEISLAHHGILFLDELPEFKRSVLEVLRQPLENRCVTISRAKVTVDFPASFMLIASMNPSPSGDFYDPQESIDSEQAVKRYLSRISGPLLDRIDMHIEVEPVNFDELSQLQKGESSADIRTRVVRARQIQLTRYVDQDALFNNAQLQARQMDSYCRLNADSKQLIKTVIERLNLSARSFDRIRKVARTIADLDHSEEIQTQHISEAIQYRQLDRPGWY